jgi:transposase-like protein
MEVKFEKINKDIQVYPEAFKRKVIDEYLSGSSTKMDLLRKYGIKTKSGIQRWMKSLGYVDEGNAVIRKPTTVNVTLSCMPQKTTPAQSEDALLLQKKIEELQRQLEDEKLRSEAYQRMIEKAEKELNISIRKKPYTR